MTDLQSRAPAIDASDVDATASSDTDVPETSEAAAGTASWSRASASDGPARRWTAEWVWSDRPALLPQSAETPYGALDPSRFDQRVLFRATFELDDVPADAELAITADSRYVALLNGIEIGRGPVRHGRRGLRHDSLRASPALRPGTNVLAIVCRFYGHAVPWWEPSVSSFTMGGGSLVAELTGGGRVITASGPTWKAREAHAWTPGAPSGMLSTQLPELFDARTDDHGWSGSDYDDTGWPAAHVLAEHSVIGPRGRTTPSTEPFGAILERPIPDLVGDVRVPQTIRWHRLAPGDGSTEREAPVDAPAAAGQPTASAPSATAAQPTPAARRSADELATIERHLSELLEARDAAGIVRETDPPCIIPFRAPHAGAIAVLDFGEIVSGVLTLRFRAPSGSIVRGAIVEVPTPVALESTAVFAITAREGLTEYTASDGAGGRYLVLSVEAEADQDVPSQHDPAVRFETVEVQERLRPRIAQPHFRSSDPAIDELFRVGLRTVDLTAHDAYIDCPTREQRAWTGDAVVHQSVDLVTNADWSLAVWNPRLLAQPRPDGILPMVVAGDFGTAEIPTIPDWSLHWIHSVHNLYRYTGDQVIVGRLLGVAEGVLRWFTPFLRDDDLLHDVTGWVLIDWSPVQVAGSSASLNALWARGLREFAEMAEWLGDTGRAAWAMDAHARVRDAFERFWDADRNAYRDNLVDDVLGTGVSEHTAATAVCAGLVPASHTAAVLALLLDRDAMFTASPLSDHGSDQKGPADGTPVSLRNTPDWDTERLVVGAQPFYRAIVHDAITDLGAQDELVRLYGDWTGLLESGPTAFRECWEGGSFAHGWSATPTHDLLVHTLGITPAAPGYERVRIAPRLGRPGDVSSLDWASGTVPTPHGPVTVHATADRVEVDSPVPVEFVPRDGAPVHLPAGRHRLLPNQPR